MFHKAVWVALTTVAILVAPAASANEARVLDSADNEILIELATEDYFLEEVEVGGESFVHVRAPRYDYTGDVGLPLLPRKAVLIGVPFGSRLELEVVSTETENLGAHRVEPVPSEEILGEGDFATPVQRFAIDEEFYERGGTYPPAVAELGAQGTLRHQRVARVVLNPFHYSARSRTLTLHRRMVVRVSIVETRRPGDLTEAVRTEPEWERTYSRSILNHEQARKWRMRHEPGRARTSARRAGDELYRVLTTESGMHRLGFDELSAEGLNGTVPVGEVAVYQRSFDADAPDPFVETPVAIDVVDVDEDGVFDGDDYVLFPAQSFEQQHMTVGYEDRYGSENAYWFTNDAGLAVRMDTRAAWLDEVGLVAPASFRDTVKFEEDVYFFIQPDDDYLDLYHWTRYQILGDNYTLPFTLYDVHPDGDALLRARYQGMTSGFHYIDFSIVNGASEENYVGQFSFVGISQNMDEDIYESASLPPSFFTDGEHTLRAVGSRGSGANLDWFEFDYDREFTSRGRLGFTNAGETGVSQFEVDGFASDEFRLFDVTDPFGTVELMLGPENVGGGGGDYTLTFQDNVPGFTRYETVEGGGYHSVTDVERRDAAGLWSDEADVIVVSYDGFASGVESLISHRESEGWVVAHALVSEVYDEFGGGLKSLGALRNYFDYAFREWERTPQFVMLVGDATSDPKGAESTSQTDFIPTLLGHGSSSYPQMTASDQWFVSSDEAPLYLPQMFIGRLSVGSGSELSNLVSKILSYENYSPSEEWRDDVYFIGDDQWHYATFMGSYSWDPGERRFTEICVELADMVAASPAGLDTTLFMLRRYTDEFHESNGVTPGSQPWDYFVSEVYPFVRNSVTPELLAGLSDGAVLVNFQGHGNRSLMTHEQLFEAFTATAPDIYALDNDGKPFIFLGFSCHLAEFHNHREGGASGKESIVEQMLFLPSGRGAVAAFACAGAAYLGDNVDFNRTIFRAFFESGTPSGPPADYFWPRWTLGSILGQGTVDFITAEGYSPRARTFVLLGDPLLHLEMSPPRLQATIDGEPILSGEYLEAGDGSPVTFVVDIIDEVEIDPSSIVVEDRGGVVDTDFYTVEAVGDTLGELGRWYRLTYDTVILDESYDIRVSATDMNGQTGVFVVHVAGREQIAFKYVINHPNPFYDTTRIIYELNQSGADVSIDIYTIGGRLIKTIDDAPGDLNYNEVEWDGVDGDGDLVANGLYLFVVEARGEDGSTATSEICRMVVARGPRFDRPGAGGR